MLSLFPSSYFIPFLRAIHAWNLLPISFTFLSFSGISLVENLVKCIEYEPDSFNKNSEFEIFELNIEITS